MLNNRPNSLKKEIEKKVFERETGYWINPDLDKELFKNWPKPDNDTNINKYAKDYEKKLSELVKAAYESNK